MFEGSCCILQLFQIEWLTTNSEINVVLQGTKKKKNMKNEISHKQGLIWFDGISTIVGDLMPNPAYTLNMYDL